MNYIYSIVWSSIVCFKVNISSKINSQCYCNYICLFQITYIYNYYKHILIKSTIMIYIF